MLNNWCISETNIILHVTCVLIKIKKMKYNSFNKNYVKKNNNTYVNTMILNNIF